MIVRFKKLHPEAVVPTKAHPQDAGFDLTCTTVENDDNCISYGTGIAVEIPDGYVGLVFPRSSVYRKDLILSNSVGVIDSNYRGEISMKFKTDGIPGGFSVAAYEVGDRIGQLLIIPYPEIEFEEAEELSESDRGEGGYGSTGA
ncbi:MAG: dUTP diphosphatase [Bacteroidales bacterium]|nr:dUTP diphosphatase [Bacteroidales bacterium]